jgi:hypothetical protein
MKNNGGASFSLQRRLQPAVIADAESPTANACRIVAGSSTQRHSIVDAFESVDVSRKVACAHTTHFCPFIFTSLTRNPVTF